MAIFKRFFSARSVRNDDICDHLLKSNPLLNWDFLNELGDGSFGKVCFLFFGLIPFIY